MADDIVFPQHGDEPDAANFAQMLGVSQRHHALVHGFELSPNFGDESVDIASGVAVVVRGEYDTSSPNIDPGETRTQTSHLIEKDGSSGVSLTADEVNHVFLDANVGFTSSPQYSINTDNDPPSDESIKLGEVDTEAESVSSQWSLLSVDGTLTFPDEDAANEIAEQLPDGTAVYVRSDDTYFRVSA